MSPNTQTTKNITSDTDIQIVVFQASQNQSANTSDVTVRGWMHVNGAFRAYHLDNNITRTISGTASYNGGTFSFDLTGPGAALEWLNHTFTIGHNSDGTKSVNFTIHMGATGTGSFGDNESVSASLTLDRIPKRPSTPGTPTFSNTTPNGATVSWTGSSNNGGSTVTDYKLRRYTGTSASGSYIDNDANNLTRNITGLQPGTAYTFVVYAKNGSADNGGYSNPSAAATISTQAGAWIRVGGVWKLAVPYIRTGGVWKMAEPYIREGGIWKPTS